jgi:hypothetical protein
MESWVELYERSTNTDLYRLSAHMAEQSTYCLKKCNFKICSWYYFQVDVAISIGYSKNRHSVFFGKFFKNDPVGRIFMRKMTSKTLENASQAMEFTIFVFFRKNNFRKKTLKFFKDFERAWPTLLNYKKSWKKNLYFSR